MAGKRGAFILFEGVDRTGKTTQSLRLVDFLKTQSVPVRHMRFPDRTTPIGMMIDGYLKKTQHMDDHTIHLLYSANRWECVSSIMRTLQEGVTIVMDRYCYSGVAYTAAKGLDLEWCKGPDRGLPAPDIVFFLDLSPEEQSKRGNWGDERYDKEEFQLKVGRTYQLLREDNWQVINAERSMDAIEKEIQEIAVKSLASACSLPISYMWAGK